MKALRRSLNKESSSSSVPRVPNAISRPNQTIAPPQKVIKALANYRSTAPQELSFSKGDFFYVKDEMDGSGWYEAHNPATGARGLVPREYFEEFKKPNQRSSVAAGPQSTGFPGLPTPGSPPFSSSSTFKSPPPRGKGAFYAVVQYDFAAERADELEAKAGEAILVIAQSNREWFVAKPIGRLGGAGLIPVSFVEIRDPGTGTPIGNVEELIERGEIPRVEEWKQKAAMYKAATIPLGKFDLPMDAGGVPNSPFVQTNHPNPGQYPFPTADSPSGNSGTASLQPSFRPVPEEPPELPQVEIINYLPQGLPISAEVMSFHHEGEGPDAECYFKIPAVWQPDPEEDVSSRDLPPPIHLTLYRTYEDFYNLQIQLLDENPVEAGRVPPEGETEPAERILPFMPGPVSEVNLLVLTQRQEELDVYLKQLCEIGRTHEHIVRSDVLYTFFCLRAGDTQKFAGMRDGDEDLGGAAMALPLTKQMAGLSTRDTADSMTTSGTGSSSGGGGRARTSSGRSGLSLSTAPTSASSPPATEDARSRASSSAGQPQQPRSLPAVPPMPQPQPADQQPPGANANGLWSASRLAASPPISATVPQPAYLKIKVFNARTDDLIAIRVHPRVTFRELMEKIRDRLGEVRRVRYRSSSYVPGSGEMGTVLEDDGMMVDWFTSGERLILYAE